MREETKTIEPPTDDERVAWKLFVHSGSRRKSDLIGPYYSVAGRTQDESPWPRNQWLEAVATDIQMTNRFGPTGCYKSGFHCYRTRADARWARDIYERLLRVRVRKVKYEGTQDASRVLVADELYIPA